MAWLPIAREVPQYVDSNGDPYSGAVLKAYEAGTSTPADFATDSTGGTTASSIALNAAGYPEVSGNTVIPHIDQTFKLALYPTQAAADSNTGEIWAVDNITFTDPSAWEKGTDIPSANDLPLGNDGIVFDITGTVTINGVTTSGAGSFYIFQFDGALTLKHDTAPSAGYDKLSLPDNVDILTAAGDICMLISDGDGNAYRVLFFPKSKALPTTQIFTSSGTYTKPAGLKAAIVEVIGGGGAGGGAGNTGAGEQSNGGGGGGGGYAQERLLASAIGATETITIGGGGAGASAAAGNAGDTSSFGALLSATGGAGGGYTAPSPNGNTASGGAGGAGSGGDVNSTGSGGGVGGASVGGTSRSAGGGGGGSAIGGGANGLGSAGTGSAGTAGSVYGGGGSGACASESAGTSRSGGAGGGGIIIVTEFY